MTERDSVLIGFAGGDDAAGRAVARRLADAVTERGAKAAVLSGDAVPGEVRAVAEPPQGRGAFAVEVTGGPRADDPLVIGAAEADPVSRLLAELEPLGLPEAPSAPYSAEEEDEVARRLEALGYID